MSGNRPGMPLLGLLALALLAATPGRSDPGATPEATPEAAPGAGGAGDDDAAGSPAILELDRPPLVDGELGEWPAGFIPLPWRDGPESGPHPRVRLAYDEQSLYLALEVPDDTLVFPERSWRYGDGFYLTVLMPGGGSRSDAHLSLGFSRVGDRLERVAVNRSGEYFPRVPMDGVRLAMGAPARAAPVPPTGRLPWNGTVTYELAVPWSLLAPAHPLAVDSLAVNVVVSDNDGSGGRAFAMLEPDPDFDTERTPARRGRPLPLRRLERRAGGARTGLVAWLPSPLLDAAAPPPVHVALHDPRGAPVRITVELERDGRVVGRGGAGLGPAEVAPGTAIRRTTVPLEVRPEAGTGPVRLRVHARPVDRQTGGGGPGPGLPVMATELTALLTDPAQLDAMRARLERLEASGSSHGAAPSRAAASALIRIEWLRAYARSAPSNAPLAPALGHWDELRDMDEALRAGSTRFLHQEGSMRLAHRSAQDGTLQPYSVQLPADFDGDRPGGYPLLVALHGSGVDERGTIATVGPRAAGRGWIVVAPQARGLSDWYVGPAERAVLEVIAHVAALYPVDSSRVALAGFSMGGYGAWRLGLRHPEIFRAVVVMSGAACPPGTVSGECAGPLLDAVTVDRPGSPRPPFLVLHGARDAAVPVAAARAMVTSLGRTGWPHEYQEFPEAGHGHPAWWDVALEWLDGIAINRLETRP